MVSDIPALIALLWRHQAPRASRRGPAPRVSVDDIVAAGIDLADAGGVEGLTMRAVASSLGVPVMTLYSQVPDKGALLALMHDQVLVDMTHQDYGAGEWRERLVRLAADNRRVHFSHPWLTVVRPETPPLGPGLMGKYERELGAVAALGLSPAQTDASLTLLVQFATASATDASAAPTPDADWWDVAGPALARYVDASDYPLSSEIGTAVGQELGAAYDADHAWEFGLARILDGLEALADAT